MHDDLRSLILAISGLGVSGRVTWNGRPQASALPAITLWLVGESRSYTYDGGSYTADRVQVDIWAASYSSALTVDRALVPAISGYRGTIGDTEFMGILLETRRDTAGPDDAGVMVHSISRDLIVHHKSA